MGMKNVIEHNQVQGNSEQPPTANLLPCLPHTHTNTPTTHEHMLAKSKSLNLFLWHKTPTLILTSIWRDIPAPGLLKFTERSSVM